VLWLNPGNDKVFPLGLIEALTLHNNGAMPFEEDPTETVQTRLRKQMQADALQPLGNEDEEAATKVPPVLMDHFPPDLLEEITQFLRLQVRSSCTRRLFPGSDISLFGFCTEKAQDRLRLVLAYLRDKHAYCFWCGVEYGGIDDMLSQCPGPEEEDHD